MNDYMEEWKRRRPIRRKWQDYPIGTKAYAVMGGHWTKTKRGWKWCTGNTFPTPGGDAVSVKLPEQAVREERENDE